MRFDDRFAGVLLAPGRYTPSLETITTSDKGPERSCARAECRVDALWNSFAMTTRALSAALVLISMLVPRSAFAQLKPLDLAQASLEDLMRTEITSAARKEQRADAVPAAVFVLTADDIRRSGLRTMPDILRLVPGVQVAQVNSSRWAVSVRGFNNVYANKLLVLVDGRSVYTPGLSGVSWDAQDVLVEDIERVEVIRGPGGATWGANAVNGVINIVTKREQDLMKSSNRT